MVKHQGCESGSSVDGEAEHSNSQNAHDGGYEGGIGHPAHAVVAASSCKHDKWKLSALKYKIKKQHDQIYKFIFHAWKIKILAPKNTIIFSKNLWKICFKLLSSINEYFRNWFLLYIDGMLI